MAGFACGLHEPRDLSEWGSALCIPSASKPERPPRSTWPRPHLSLFPRRGDRPSARPWIQEGPGSTGVKHVSQLTCQECGSCFKIHSPRQHPAAREGFSRPPWSGVCPADARWVRTGKDPGPPGGEVVIPSGDAREKARVGLLSRGAVKCSRGPVPGRSLDELFDQDGSRGHPTPTSCPLQPGSALPGVCMAFGPAGAKSQGGRGPRLRAPHHKEGRCVPKARAASVSRMRVWKFWLASFCLVFTSTGLSVTHNVVLLPGAQEHDPVLHTHTSVLLQILFPSGSRWGAEERSPRRTAGPGYSQRVVWRCQSLALFLTCVFIALKRRAGETALRQGSHADATPRPPATVNGKASGWPRVGVGGLFCSLPEMLRSFSPSNDTTCQEELPGRARITVVISAPGSAPPRPAPRTQGSAGGLRRRPQLPVSRHPLYRVSFLGVPVLRFTHLKDPPRPSSSKHKQHVH